MSASPSPSWSPKAPKARAMPPRPSSSNMSRCAPVISIADAVLPGPVDLAGGAETTSRSNSIAARSGRCEAAIRDAAHVVECELVNNRVVAAPLETRGALGEFDASSGRMHLTASAAGAHAIRDLLADFRLPHPPRKAARQHSRRRRRFRDEERALSGMGAGAVGGAAPRPSGASGSATATRISCLHAWPRQLRPRAAWRWIGMADSWRSKPKSSPIMGAYVSTVAPVVPTMAMAARWAASTTFR